MTPSCSVLISGASVAGPTLAYWLRRHGFTPTVLELTPAIRAGLGGHAVDLFGPAVDIAERMELLEQVRSARTMTKELAFELPGKRPVEVDFERLTAGISDRPVEIMRGELARILYEATRDDVEYVFGDSIRAIDEHDEGMRVTFEHGVARSFDLLVGADGLHSNVRTLCFGDESRFRRYLGGYLAAFSVPNYRALSRRMVIYNSTGRLAAMYGVRQTAQARALFSSAATRDSNTTTTTVPGNGSCSARSSPARGGRCHACSPSSTTPRTSTSTRSARSGWLAGRRAASPWSETPATPRLRPSAAGRAWP